MTWDWRLWSFERWSGSDWWEGSEEAERRVTGSDSTNLRLTPSCHETGFLACLVLSVGNLWKWSDQGLFKVLGGKAYSFSEKGASPFGKGLKAPGSCWYPSPVFKEVGLFSLWCLWWLNSRFQGPINSSGKVLLRMADKGHLADGPKPHQDRVGNLQTTGKTLDGWQVGDVAEMSMLLQQLLTNIILQTPINI